MREMIDKVSMTRYSCFCGFHSTWLLLADSTSPGTGTEGFSCTEDSVEMGVDGSSGISIVSRTGIFPDIWKCGTIGEKRKSKAMLAVLKPGSEDFDVGQAYN
jgi:hypothetical protein